MLRIQVILLQSIQCEHKLKFAGANRKVLKWHHWGHSQVTGKSNQSAILPDERVHAPEANQTRHLSKKSTFYISANCQNVDHGHVWMKTRCHFYISRNMLIHYRSDCLWCFGAFGREILWLNIQNNFLLMKIGGIIYVIHFRTHQVSFFEPVVKPQFQWIWKVV